MTKEQTSKETRQKTKKEDKVYSPYKINALNGISLDVFKSMLNKDDEMFNIISNIYNASSKMQISITNYQKVISAYFFSIILLNQTYTELSKTYKDNYLYFLNKQDGFYLALNTKELIPFKNAVLFIADCLNINEESYYRVYSNHDKKDKYHNSDYPSLSLNTAYNKCKYLYDVLSQNKSYLQELYDLVAIKQYELPRIESSIKSIADLVLDFFKKEQLDSLFWLDIKSFKINDYLKELNKDGTEFLNNDELVKNLLTEFNLFIEKLSLLELKDDVYGLNDKLDEFNKIDKINEIMTRTNENKTQFTIWDDLNTEASLLFDKDPNNLRIVPVNYYHILYRFHLIQETLALYLKKVGLISMRNNAIYDHIMLTQSSINMHNLKNTLNNPYIAPSYDKKYQFENEKDDDDEDPTFLKRNDFFAPIKTNDDNTLDVNVLKNYIRFDDVGILHQTKKDIEIMGDLDQKIEPWFNIFFAKSSNLINQNFFSKISANNLFSYNERVLDDTDYNLFYDTNHLISVISTNYIIDNIPINQIKNPTTKGIYQSGNLFFPYLHRYRFFNQKDLNLLKNTNKDKNTDFSKKLVKGYEDTFYKIPNEFINVHNLDDLNPTLFFYTQLFSNMILYYELVVGYAVFNAKNDKQNEELLNDLFFILNRRDLVGDLYKTIQDAYNEENALKRDFFINLDKGLLQDYLDVFFILNKLLENSFKDKNKDQNKNKDITNEFYYFINKIPPFVYHHPKEELLHIPIYTIKGLEQLAQQILLQSSDASSDASLSGLISSLLKDDTSYNFYTNLVNISQYLYVLSNNVFLRFLNQDLNIEYLNSVYNWFYKNKQSILEFMVFKKYDCKNIFNDFKGALQTAKDSFSFIDFLQLVKDDTFFKKRFGLGLNENEYLYDIWFILNYRLTKDEYDKCINGATTDEIISIFKKYYNNRSFIWQLVLTFTNIKESDLVKIELK